MSQPKATNLTQGAYGLQLSGLSAPSLCLSTPADWPLVRLSRRPLDGDAPARTVLGDDLADLVFTSGWSVRVDRVAGSVVFFAPSESADDEIVHPYLAPAAMRFAGWHGRAALHAGSFVCGDGAWGLLAARGGGKSTTLGHLAVGGIPVLADDLLVVDRQAALSGPRCIDLRPVAVAAAAHDRPLEPVRGGERLRLALDPVAPAVRLRGFFFLEWGDALSVGAIAPAQRLRGLARRFRTGAADPAQLLDLARLPAWRVVRPRDPSLLDSVCERLLDTASH